MKKIIRRIKMWYWKRFCPSRYSYEVGKDVAAAITQAMNNAVAAMRGFAENMRNDLSAPNESKENTRDIPQIKKGDIVRVENCHSAEPHFYEVHEIFADGVVSQPAGFHHRHNEITAVYRYDGKHFACIWED